MSVTPDIATIAGLIGDRARAAILMSLMDGRALTATELARTAEITKATASSHLAKLLDARLLDVEQQGRHRYYRLADHDVAAVIEQLSGLANRIGAKPVVTGPSDAALRKARVCYDHLAGELGVSLLESLKHRQFVTRSTHLSGPTLSLTAEGMQFLQRQGVDVEMLETQRRPLCLECLDWSVRRHHLAGAVGAAILERCLARGWARRQRGTRAVIFSTVGERDFRKQLMGGASAIPPVD